MKDTLSRICDDSFDRQAMVAKSSYIVGVMVNVIPVLPLESEAPVITY